MRANRPARTQRHRLGDRGAAAVELVLIAPVVVGLFMMLAQWAVREQGQRAVNAAAREGAVAAAAWRADADAGQESVDSTLRSAGADLTGVVVDSRQSATDATVTVTAEVPSLLPGFALTVTSTQTAPREVFVP